eukprot:gb/GFBE01032358.1/.p1 GENE.gb/GFBE01032358.1/~~gb/GFBE01032358.1/.p1  ORF type:complete len:513 (+),score=83.30 gb/GFBE01032358.1/:1-1539(+)
MDVINQHGVIDSVKSAMLPLSAFALCAYPLLLFIQIYAVGHARSRAPFAERVQSSQLSVEKRESTVGSALFPIIAAALAAAPLLLVFPRSVMGFIASPYSPQSPGPLPPSGITDFSAASLSAEDVQGTSFAGSGVSVAVGCLAGLGAVSLALRLPWKRLHSGPAAQDKKGRKCKMPRKSSGVLRRCASSKEVIYTSCKSEQPQGSKSIFWYNPPADAEASMWHHVDLQVSDWLDEDTGLFRYVNEMPRGCLQKFELQTKLEKNVIREDVKGSRKLQSFGKPVPFNYGCFPQTYRDPCEHDEIYNAPGDDDPLDVIELSQQPVGVGEVVVCRPLGAVCLIDEGQADWKVIVVNTKLDGPLASARSIQEVEQIAPGRIEQALRWIDDFKQHSSKSGTTLHYEIHDACRATALIKKDHAAWKRLLAEARATGSARGHWIGQPQKVSHPSILNMGMPSTSGGIATPNRMTGTTVPSLATVRRAHTLRRQMSGGETTSDGETSSSSSPLSSDAEQGF